LAVPLSQTRRPLIPVIRFSAVSRAVLKAGRDSFESARFSRNREKSALIASYAIHRLSVVLECHHDGTFTFSLIAHCSCHRGLVVVAEQDKGCAARVQAYGANAIQAADVSGLQSRYHHLCRALDAAKDANKSGYSVGSNRIADGLPKIHLDEPVGWSIRLNREYHSALFKFMQLAHTGEGRLAVPGTVVVSVGVTVR